MQLIIVTMYIQNRYKDVCGSPRKKMNNYPSCISIDRVSAFKTRHLRTSVKGGAQMCCVNASIVPTFTQQV